MKKMAAAWFKAHCLSVLDEVQAKRQTIVITKRGKPVAKLVPVTKERDDIFGFFAGKAKITGDVVSPALSLEEWGGAGGPGFPPVEGAPHLPAFGRCGLSSEGTREPTSDAANSKSKREKPVWLLPLFVFITANFSSKA